MVNRYINMRGHEVRGILDGRKTQTRRVLKPQPPTRDEWYKSYEDDGLTPEPYNMEAEQDQSGQWWWNNDDMLGRLSVPYKVGDRLWVREAFARAWENDPYSGEKTYYRADGEPFDEYELPDGSIRDGVPWRPSIHMPRWASRLTLTVTDVRAQRVQDISSGDAIAEGMPPSHPSIDSVSRELGYPDFPRSSFAQLWDSINAKRGHGWDTNPWVVALTFTYDRRGEGNNG